MANLSCTPIIGEMLSAYESVKKKRRKFGTLHKALFHVHTPASHDYKLIKKNKHYYKDLNLNEVVEHSIEKQLFPQISRREIFEITFDENTFVSLSEYISYLLIADSLCKNKVELAVVTDHNTIKGFEKLSVAISELHEYKHYDVFPVLCLGIEISCGDANHIVGIFKFENNIEVQIEKWLDENIINEEAGTYHTSFEVLKTIHDFGGLGYFAHIDTSKIFNKRHLSGAFKKKLLQSEYLTAIGLSDPDKEHIIKKNLLTYRNDKLPFVIDCDCHSIDEMNKNFFWIKGGKRDFNLIKNAFRDFEISIQFDHPTEPKQYIEGMVIDNNKGCFLYSDSKINIMFSDSLNCIIGGRGSGKSTILNVLSFALGQGLPGDRDSGELLLDQICNNSKIWIMYRYKGEDYIIAFMPPVKNFNDENIVKHYTELDPLEREHSYDKYYYDSKEISEYNVRNYIDIFKVSYKGRKPFKKKITNLTTRKKMLSQFFTSSYSINDLVNIAGRSDISLYISNILMKNKTLSKYKKPRVKTVKSLMKLISDIEETKKKRNNDVKEVIQKYNRQQNGKLRIVYKQNNFFNQKINFMPLFSIKKYYRKYNIKTKNLAIYVNELVRDYDIAYIFNLFRDDNFKEINSILDVKEFCTEMTQDLIEKEIREITDVNITEFYLTLKNDIFSSTSIEFWRELLLDYHNNIENFDLEFNVNNKEEVEGRAEKYLSIRKLSLGQKVVAMLSFILSYCEFENNYSPLIIDQPEDNLDNQYIYKNLVKDLRDIRGKRQIIIATHSSTIVTNAKAEQVIVMKSDNDHGWIDKSGYPTQPNITKAIVNNLEGGKDSFLHKYFLYEDILTK